MKAAELCRKHAAARIQAMQRDARNMAHSEEVSTEYVLLKYPERPPNKLTAGYRGPMRRVSTLREQGHVVGYVLKDLVTQAEVKVSNNRVTPFEHAGLSLGEMKALATAAEEEFPVEAVRGHRGRGTDATKFEFHICWAGYEESESTWEKWENVAGNTLVSKYLLDHGIRVPR